MSRRNKVKPGYIGPAFYEWLAHLEMCEDIVVRNKVRDKKRAARGYTFNDELWPTGDQPISRVVGQDAEILMSSTVAAMLPVDAWVAHLVRSSVKYRITHDTMLDIAEKYQDEIDYIHRTMTIELPYDPITVVFEGVGPKEDDVMVNLSLQTAAHRSRVDGEFYDVNYPALGIGENDEFISASICFHRAKGVELTSTGDTDASAKLSHCPVEIHFNKGLGVTDTKWINAIAPGTHMSARGAQMIEETRKMILYFLSYFSLRNLLRRKQPGLSPALMAEQGKRRKPKHRNKFNRPMFEHFVIELEVDEPEAQQSGITRAMHKKRQHQVQGHRRVCKSGKVTWVKPHWRGDKNLGVIRKDYEMTTHEFDPSN